MNEKTTHYLKKGAPVSKPQEISASSSKVPLERGAPISNPQPVQSTPNQPDATQPSGQNPSSGSDTGSGQNSSQGQSDGQ